MKISTGTKELGKLLVTNIIGILIAVWLISVAHLIESFPNLPNPNFWKEAGTAVEFFIVYPFITLSYIFLKTMFSKEF